MQYKFPEITHIDQVLAAIQGVEGFIVAQRDWGTVVNYVQMGPDMFPEVLSQDGPELAMHHAIRRECRGLCFNKQGELVSRPLHKFWNAGERRETLLENIDLSKPHIILDKMDGSMIRPIPTTGGTYRLGTRMGITDVAQQAETYVANKPNINTFILGAIGAGYTPIFEWCSRQQRIVIDYPEDRLVLIAVRHVLTGEYLTYQQMQELAGEYGLDLVRAYAGTVESMQQLVNDTRALEDQEGYIIRWHDGHMVKLKADSYVRIHRAKDNLIHEKGLIEMILDQKLDDVKSYLPIEDLTRVETYEREFWQGVQDTIGKWQLVYMDAKSLFGTDRKKFAIEWAPTMDSSLRGMIFQAWDNSEFDFPTAVLELIRKNLGTQTRVDSVRYLWGGLKYKEESQENE